MSLEKGGIGVVAAALHLDLREGVALKLLLREAAALREAVERFLREPRLVRNLTSEQVVKVIDVGRLSDSGLPYLPMELLVGHDLDRSLPCRGPLPVRLAYDDVIQGCDLADKTGQARASAARKARTQAEKNPKAKTPSTTPTSPTSPAGTTKANATSKPGSAIGSSVDGCP